MTTTVLLDGHVVVLAQEGEPTEEEEHQEFEAHNPWLPETSEIIWGGLAFLIVMAIMYKFAWPAIKKSMAARTDRIAKDLSDASSARADAERRAAEIRAAKGDIEAERARQLAEADAAAERVLVEGRARLEAEVAELEARVAAEIVGATDRIASELQAEVAGLAMAAAERVVIGELNASTQAELVERYIATVGASNGEVTR
jgi:F-type H+-transporting ATPase subunit b